MSKIINLLLVSSDDHEQQSALLSCLSEQFLLIDHDRLKDIDSQCLADNIDIVVVVPPEKKEAQFISTSRFPEHTPLLWLGPEKAELWSNSVFSGMVVFTSFNPSPREITSHLNSLVRFNNLHRTVQEKERQLAALTEKLNQHQKSVQEHTHFLDLLATRDGLTGLFNRKHLNSALPKEFDKCVEKGTDLSIFLLNLDFFNEINKSGGISYGDFVLNDFSARLTSAMQPSGICFRFSGESFLALLPEMAIGEAYNLADSLREELRRKPFAHYGEKKSITFSAGLVSFREHKPETPDDFIAMAEKALFFAKSEGRDRIIRYRPAKIERTSPPDIVFFRDTLSKILDKTRISAIESLQLLAKDIAGEKNRNHIHEVRKYVELLGSHMQLPDSIIKTFKNAITLHTSIRFLLHNEMINRKQSFSEDDRRKMNDFPLKLAEITEMFEYFSNERTVLLHHGERYDGTGYPEGLKGNEIPLGARIFSIVDALAAMNADRPYRDRLGPEKIVSELTEGAGTQFDPSLVVKVLEIIKVEKLLDLQDKIIDKAIATINNSFPDHTSL